MEEDVQHDKATQLFGIPPTGTRGAASSQLANVNKLTNFALAHKQGADHLMLEATPQKRLMIFTDPSMIDLVKDEKKKGRFPKELEILKVKLPADLAARVAESPKTE